MLRIAVQNSCNDRVSALIRAMQLHTAPWLLGCCNGYDHLCITPHQRILRFQTKHPVLQLKKICSLPFRSLIFQAQLFTFQPPEPFCLAQLFLSERGYPVRSDYCFPIDHLPIHPFKVFNGRDGRDRPSARVHGYYNNYPTTTAPRPLGDVAKLKPPTSHQKFLLRSSGQH